MRGGIAGYVNIPHILYNCRSLYRRFRPVRVLDYYQSDRAPKGRALVSYVPSALRWKEGDNRLLGHTNLWESAEVARIFNSLGYIVDAISFFDVSFKPKHEYDVVFDIHQNIPRFSTAKTRKLFHFTGSDPVFTNQAERQRLDDLKARRGVELKPRRGFSDSELKASAANAEAADVITLVGNDVTVSTFPLKMQAKIRCIPVTGSYLSNIKSPQEIPGKREFLWFGGGGAVLKGLDLVLEVFARNPALTIHIVGLYENEFDFMRAYRHEFAQCPNIISHGFLYPSSDEFHRATQDVVAFVFPSCSESTSTAAVTCMQYGLVPIVSVNSGITLSEKMGILLKDCTREEIESAVRKIAGSTDEELKRMLTCSQQFALKTFSREEFSRAMESAISELMA